MLIYYHEIVNPFCFYGPLISILLSGLCVRPFVCLFVPQSVPLQVKIFGRGSFDEVEDQST